MVLKIRMTKALHNHIQATAAHVGKSKSEVLQAVCRSYLNSRPVGISMLANCTTSPEKMLYRFEKLQGKSLLTMNSENTFTGGVKRSGRKKYEFFVATPQRQVSQAARRILSKRPNRLIVTTTNKKRKKDGFAA